jgi:hypothetical protein
VIERFYILPSTFVAVVVGVGAALVAASLDSSRIPSQLATVGAIAALSMIPLIALFAHFGDADQSTNLVDDAYGQDLLAPLEPNALLIVNGDVATMAADYAQLVEGNPARHHAAQCREAEAARLCPADAAAASGSGDSVRGLPARWGWPDAPGRGQLAGATGLHPGAQRARFW